MLECTVYKTVSYREQTLVDSFDNKVTKQGEGNHWEECCLRPSIAALVRVARQIQNIKDHDESVTYIDKISEYVLVHKSTECYHTIADDSADRSNKGRK